MMALRRASRLRAAVHRHRERRSPVAMKRFAAFDPPEYASWSPDPAVLAEYRAVLEGSARSSQLRTSLSRPELLGLYEGMLRFRLHDIALKRWVKQGVISKAWLGTGEEAVTVGN